MRTVGVKLTADTSGYLASVGKASAATQQFASKGAKAFSDHEQSIRKLSTGAGRLGTALAVGLGVAVKSAANFDAAMSKVAATGSDARKNMDELRKAALKAGADTKFSATEAAGGVEALAKAGVSAKDTLGGGLTGALNLAAAGNMSVADSAEVAATAMAQFNLKGKDVPHIADLIAAGAGKAQGEVSDMAMALKQGGLVASQFGISIEETTGTLAAFANAGLIGSDAGTSFKTMLLRLANPAKEAKVLMKDLGINAYDAQGKFVGLKDLAGQLADKLGPLSDKQRDAALATIFGSDAIRAANVLYKAGSTGKGSIEDWTNKVNDSGYAAKSAAMQMDNLKGDLEQLKGSLETALIGLGEGGQGPLRGLTQSLTELVNKFNDLSPKAKETFLVVGAGAAGTLLTVAALGKLIVAANEAKVALVALGGSSAALKFGGVGAALAGVYVALDQLEKKFPSFAAQLTASNNAATDDFTYLGDRLKVVWRAMVTDANNAVIGVLTAMDKLFSKIPAIPGSPFEKLKNGIHTALGEAQADLAATEKKWADTDFKEKDVKLKADKKDLTVKIAASKAELKSIPDKLTKLRGHRKDLDDKIAAAKKQLKTVPPEKRTELKAKIDQLIAKRKAASADINRLKGKQVDLKADIAQALARKRALQAAINSLHGKTVQIQIKTLHTITTKYGSVAASKQMFPAYGGPIHRESGGPIGLDGGGTVPGSSPHQRADNVPVMATAGEYMQDVPAHKFWGTPFMDAVLSRDQPRVQQLAAIPRADGGAIPERHVSDYRYASGGQVEWGMGGGGTTIINNHYHFDRYIGNRNELVREMNTLKRQNRMDVILK